MTQPAQPVQTSAPTTVPAPQPRTITFPPLLGIPVATITHLVVVIVGAILLIVNGDLSHDYLIWSSAVEGGNGLVAVGRGLDAHAKP